MDNVSVGVPLDTKDKVTSQWGRFSLNHRVRMFSITLLSDILAVTFSTLAVHSLVYGGFLFNYLSMGEFEHVLFLIICLSLYFTTRLYPGIALNPALEIKHVTLLTLVSFSTVFCFLLIRKPAWTTEKLVLALISMFSVVLVLGVRWLVRILSVHLGIWGEPVVMVGSSEKVEEMVGYYNRRRRLGFLPVLGVSEQPGEQPFMGVQTMGLSQMLSLQEEYFQERKIHTVLVNTRFMSQNFMDSDVNLNLLKKFKHMIFVSDMDWLEGVSISIHDFEGMVGVEVRRNLLSPVNMLLKRFMDIALAILLMILFTPLFLLTALLIRLDSPGPIFFKQERIGRKGGRILIHKFRSMQVGADQILAAFLETNPEARAEWEQTQKLRNDPRITRVGKWIRKFSIDEFPQLLNILKGDMSLVGPRPIVDNEIPRYQDNFDVYSTMRPGVTGMWQVSGRNHTTYDERVMYDVYYIRNWSVWLDIYILLRTIWVVISRDGAY